MVAIFLKGGDLAALDGRVIDAVSGKGIAGAIVTVGDQDTTTDTDGRFHTANNTSRILVRACGYRRAAYSADELARDGGRVTLTPFVPKALYLSAYGIGSGPLRSAALALVREGPFNALVIDIKSDRGMVPYPSLVPLAKVSGARQMTTIPNLSSLVDSLHAQGIYVIARIVVFKDNTLANARPDLAVKRQDERLFHDKEELSWTDPFQAEVRDYNIAIAVEAARAGFDEIQFDYVRFPDATQQLKLSQPATEAARVAAIDMFLTEARRQLKPYNIFLAVDIFGYVCWNTNDTGIGQQLEHLIKIVDYLSPMLYPSCFQCGIPGYRNPVAHPYEIVQQSLEHAEHRVNVPPLRFRPWIQEFRDYAFDRRAFGTEEIEAQIRAASDFGSDGWMIWNPTNRYFSIAQDTKGHSIEVSKH